MPNINWKREIFTIPNLLSLFRLALIPVYIVMYLNAVTPLDHYLSAGVLTLSCLTDMFDGMIARKFNMISNIGKILDPLADKLTQFTLALCLAIKNGNLWLWLVIALLIVKEFYQLIALAVSIRNGRVLKGALMSGKICTTVLFVSLVSLVMFYTMPPLAVDIIAIVDILFLLYAFVDYIVAYCRKDKNFESVEDATNLS